MKTAADMIDDITRSEFERLFGERLCHQRESAGLTQQQLADELGVSRSALAMAESGKSGWGAYRLFVLCKALGISADTLIRCDH